MDNLLLLHERRAGRSSKSLKRAKDIVETAREIFSEVGYEKTTTAEIAQKLGISEATVFTYFTSKRELCMQVISDWYLEMSEEYEKEVPRIHGTRAQLAFIVRKHLNVLIRDGQGLCALVLTEGRRPDNGFTELLTQLQRGYTAPLMAVLSAAQGAGSIRSDMPLRLMRNMVFGSMEHILWECIVTRRIPDLDATAIQVTEMLWAAFAPIDKEKSVLAQFHHEVADALRRSENAATD